MLIDITPEYMEEKILWLGGISDKPEQKGTTRPLYSDAWVRAQHALKEEWEKIPGMEVEFDEVGNLIGTIKGSEDPDFILGSGSHVDSVVDGGNLDGALGVLSSWLAVKGLVEKYGQPKKSIRIVSFAEEEGNRFPTVFWGSKNFLGIQDNEEVKDIADAEGVKFVDAMRESGFDFNEGEARYCDLDAWIELHIEQGNFLEEEGQQIGVVTSIVGQRRWTITLKGEANHAGTTLMSYRRDAVDCFSRIAVNCLDKAKAEGDPLVLTFGQVIPSPNSVNVVPGEVVFSMDCRHTDGEFLDSFTGELEEDMRRIAGEMGLEIEIDKWMTEEPVPMDKEVFEIIEKVCEDNDFSYRVMHSGAGHDTQLIAPRIPSGMIFVPSVNGISHSPDEYTDPADCAEGVKVLAEAMRQIAY